MAAQVEMNCDMFEGAGIGGAQFKSATPRALTAQHWGVSGVPGQRIVRLLKVGTPMVMAAPKRAEATIVEKCIVGDGVAVRMFRGLWVIMI